MKLQEVQSSTLKSFGYEVATGVLAVEFNGGGLYVYQGVPEKVAKEFEASESKGKYFGANIKDRYVTTKIEH